MKILIKTVVILVATLSLVFCNRGDDQSSIFSSFFGGAAAGATGGATALPVVAEDVKRQTISAYIYTTATLNANNQVDVIAQSSGRVDEVLAEEGDRVEAGDLLAKLDQSSALLDLSSAQAHYDNTKRIFERTEKLAQTNDVSSEEYANQKYQFELRRIQLVEARNRLANTEIRSPIDGVVTQRNIAVGASVSNNQRAFGVGDFDPLIAYIYIPEREIESVRPGQRATVIPDAVDEEFAGRVALISPVVNPASGTVKVTIEVTDDKSRLKPGMFAAVRVPTETRPNVLVVPKKSVVVERDQSIVYIMADGIAARVQVELGLTHDDVVEVRSGLNDGDKVITVGQEAVRDQQAVRIAGAPVPEAVPQAAGAAAGGETRASGAAGGAAQDQRPAGGGGFDLSQMPDAQREQMEQRMLVNPQVKEAYETALKEDPGLEKDKDKRVKFFTEQIAKLRESGGFGGR